MKGHHALLLASAICLAPLAGCGDDEACDNSAPARVAPTQASVREVGFSISHPAPGSGTGSYRPQPPPVRTYTPPAPRVVRPYSPPVRVNPPRYTAPTSPHYAPTPVSPYGPLGPQQIGSSHDDNEEDNPQEDC